MAKNFVTTDRAYAVVSRALANNLQVYHNDLFTNVYLLPIDEDDILFVFECNQLPSEMEGKRVTFHINRDKTVEFKEYIP